MLCCALLHPVMLCLVFLAIIVMNQAEITIIIIIIILWLLRRASLAQKLVEANISALLPHCWLNESGLQEAATLWCTHYNFSSIFRIKEYLKKVAHRSFKCCVYVLSWLAYISNMHLAWFVWCWRWSEQCSWGQDFCSSVCRHWS